MRERDGMAWCPLSVVVGDEVVEGNVEGGDFKLWGLCCPQLLCPLNASLGSKERRQMQPFKCSSGKKTNKKNPLRREREENYAPLTLLKPNFGTPEHKQTVLNRRMH